MASLSLPEGFQNGPGLLRNTPEYYLVLWSTWIILRCKQWGQTAYIFVAKGETSRHMFHFQETIDKNLASGIFARYLDS